MVGTFPPTECGLASFTRSCANALCDHLVGVIEIVDAGLDFRGWHDDFRGSQARLRPPVKAQWSRGDRASLRHAALVINTFDALVLQHEFGIYGGADGDEVLELAAEISIPIVTVLHTVPRSPSLHQQRIVEELARRSEIVIVLSESARRRLYLTTSVAEMDAVEVVVVPHGAFEVPSRETTTKQGSGDGPLMLTWGLLGPGKGIEQAIDALALLSDLDPAPVYWIVGETHPKVRKAQGEQYRDSLRQRAMQRGVSERVRFIDGYSDLATLHAIIAQADVVVLPYESREQVTSGVLVEAIAAGLPVVATDFPHARELLNQGCGTVVRHNDPQAMAAAIRLILLNPDVRRKMSHIARDIAPTLYWPTVGATLSALIDRCYAASVCVEASQGRTA
jgi:polysaccharide biosynthesis protein PslF